MSQDGKQQFGYKPSQTEAKSRSYNLRDYDWVDLFVFMHACVEAGACPTVYTSEDGNALCVSVKHGKTAQKYWIGPDDLAKERIDKMYREWGVDPNRDNPFDRHMRKEFEQERLFRESSEGKGGKDT